jgi:hypothetical protein
MDGGRWRFSPKPLVVIFFRAPRARSISKKPLEPTQRPTNAYMGWATPPTPRSSSARRNVKEESVVVSLPNVHVRVTTAS